MTDTRLQGVFNTFDMDNSGVISIDNMVMTFSKIGQEISKKEINEILSKHDKDGAKSIDFDEFKKMVFG